MGFMHVCPVEGEGICWLVFMLVCPVKGEGVLGYTPATSGA